MVAVLCRVAGKTWDLIRPLEADCQLELLDFEHPLGKDVRGLALPKHVQETCSYAAGLSCCSTVSRSCYGQALASLLVHETRAVWHGA